MLFGAAAREVKRHQQNQHKEFLTTGLVVGIICFIYWGPAHLGQNILVFMYSHNNCVYFLVEIKR